MRLRQGKYPAQDDTANEWQSQNLNSDNLHSELYLFNLISMIKSPTFFSCSYLKVLFLMINCFHSITDVKYFTCIDANY